MMLRLGLGLSRLYTGSIWGQTESVLSRLWPRA
jgi:hypothetical protein